MHKHKALSAFTIVELLIVIVVIGILSTISIIVYSGVSSRATVATIQSDLDSNSRKIQLYYTLYNSYPTTLDASKCPTAPVADTNYCLKLSSSNTINSYSATASTYNLNIANGSLCYQVTDSTPITNACTAGTGTYATVSSVTNAANPSSLPAGWVPAGATLSSTYYDYTDSGTNYRVYVWTSGTGSATVSTSGLVDLLIVGGGGSGGSYYGGGGGGAGGFLNLSNAYINNGSNNIVVGNGGVAGTSRPISDQDNGSSSVFGNYYSPGGGAGGGDRSAGRSGASGGGSANSTRPVGSGLNPIGNNGGTAVDATGATGGGGGGAGAVGGNAPNVNTGGAGGSGAVSTITGSSVTFCAGGGGSGQVTGGVGGSSKGGNGGGGSGLPTAGATNTGSGGGGKNDSLTQTYGGSGGSGVVILRIRI